MRGQQKKCHTGTLQFQINALQQEGDKGVSGSPALRHDRPAHRTDGLFTLFVPKVNTGHSARNRTEQSVAGRNGGQVTPTTKETGGCERRVGVSLDEKRKEKEEPREGGP